MSIEGVDDYKIEVWLPELGAKPVERISHEDYSRCFEMCMAHVLALDNGQYALVTEKGCSCYESEDAYIDLFPTKEKAMDSFRKWVKENRE